MIESLGALFRFIQLAANMIVIGGCVFLAIAEDKNAPAAASWSSRAKQALPWFAFAVIVGLFGLLATTTAQATGITENAWRIGAWLTFIQKTRIGLIWTLREICAVALLGVTLYVRFFPSARWRYAICASFAVLPLAIGTLASHSAAEEKSIEAILPYTLHLVLASVWLGGLPGVLAVLFSNRTDAHSADRATLLPLKRFSTMALPVMVAIIATGIIVADRMVSPSYAALFATTYGWLLNAKLALLGAILLIAGRAHFVWLPSLTNGRTSSSHEMHTLRRWLTREFGLAVALLAVATLLAGAVPAKHEVIDYWPYPFRFSIAATWDDWLVRTLVFSGVLLLIISTGLLVMGTRKRWGRTWRVIVPAPLLIFSLILIFYPISVQSYPETYRKTPVPFDSISISNGMSIFSENCVPCHGPQAKGDGPLAKTLPKKPIDLLTEPHTAMHTAGDFFHWLTYGRFNGVMPAFGDKLSEEERWDVLNFLHANARGYQARIITPRILPGQPFMVPPNFSYSAHDGLRGTLKDFRGQEHVLLVLFSWPESQARLDELRAAYALLRERNTALLAVPMNDPLPDDMSSFLAKLPFPVVIQGAGEIGRSYALFRRTITYPDLFGSGTVPKHMEFLFDRFGYLRARWIPERSEGPGWSDLDFLKQQIDQLQREKEILPPPDDHVH
ncbi:MAG: CopD family protein [Nitrospira sp.]|nr:CopD family protein [Nitrospira sp.]MCP9462273.1 CopD family protein [Nitrospira sp.]MCP9474470.1 CopD family protein [Nitrospira sp.]